MDDGVSAQKAAGVRRDSQAADFLRAKEANEGCERDPEENIQYQGKAARCEPLYQNAGKDDGRYVIDSKAGGSFGEAQAVKFWKHPLKWLGNVAMVGGLIGLFVHYLQVGPKAREESDLEMREGK